MLTMNIVADLVFSSLVAFAFVAFRICLLVSVHLGYRVFRYDVASSGMDMGRMSLGSLNTTSVKNGFRYKSGS